MGANLGGVMRAAYENKGTLGHLASDHEERNTYHGKSATALLHLCSAGWAAALLACTVPGAFQGRLWLFLIVCVVFAGCRH